MEGTPEVAHKMDRIREIFQEGKNFALATEDLSTLNAHLDHADPEFRSVAFEGASMGIALKDLSEENNLHRWRSFIEGPAANHITQVHVGLGWALGQRRISPYALTGTLHPLLQFRVFDGWGYYDGIFRSRSSIRDQQRSDEISEQSFRAYDQGLGRSLWYRGLGDHLQIPKHIEKFPADRHADLWRGVGIACAYVGGCKETVLQELYSESASHGLQLAMGSAWAARARIQANSLTSDIEKVCVCWCHRSASTAMLLTVNTEPALILSQENILTSWISQMELALSRP